VKLFVTATVEARAQRRWKEMRERGAHVTLEAITEEIRARDERDRGRKDAPLRVADGAFVIDTSAMTKDEALAAAIRAVAMARR
jgi:CMP/dCMP kinase